MLRFAIPTGLVIGVAAYAAYRTARLTDSSAGVAGGRTSATLTILIISLWVVLMLARPLAGWKLALVATMAGAAALIIAIPALAHGIFLLDVTPLLLTEAVIIGAVAIVVVEIAHGGAAFVSRVHGRPHGLKA